MNSPSVSTKRSSKRSPLIASPSPEVLKASRRARENFWAMSLMHCLTGLFCFLHHLSQRSEKGTVQLICHHSCCNRGVNSKRRKLCDLSSVCAVGHCYPAKQHSGIMDIVLFSFESGHKLLGAILQSLLRADRCVSSG